MKKLFRKILNKIDRFLVNQSLIKRTRVDDCVRLSNLNEDLIQNMIEERKRLSEELQIPEIHIHVFYIDPFTHEKIYLE